MMMFLLAGLCSVQAYANDRECTKASSGTEICKGDRVLFSETKSYLIKQHRGCDLGSRYVVCNKYSLDKLRIPVSDLSETPFRSGGFLCQPNTFDSQSGCGGPSAIEGTVTGIGAGKLVNVIFYAASPRVESVYEMVTQLSPEEVFPVLKGQFCTEDGKEFKVGQELTYKSLPARIKTIYSNGVARVQYSQSVYSSSSFESLPYLKSLSSAIATSPDCGK